jgi:16S rRNA (cytidine1402-2'-O)-methyltransferase
MAGTLYVVATPLGNLEDITLRALRVLREVDCIAAEDTRHSRKLLAHYGIGTPLTSYHDHVEAAKAPRLVARLQAGENIALISDAGTPGIADPGYRLVRGAIEAGVRVVPIPGPSVVAAGLSVAGVPTDRFVFEGFVPAKQGGRRAYFERLRGEPRTIVCFEAGRRLAASLRDLADVMGARPLVVAREVTKLYEDFVRGDACTLAARAGDLTARGEVTCSSRRRRDENPTSEDAIRAAVARLRAEGLHLKEIAKRLARETGWSARDVYRIGLEERGAEGATRT